MTKLRPYLFATLQIFAATLLLWLLRDELTLANFSLLYLVVVVVVAIRQGIGPSLLAAVFSFLSFNFFLVKPFYTFAVADPRDLIDLLIYLIVALVTGQLAARARQQAEVARQRANEQDMLFRLTSTLNQITTSEGVHEALKHMLETHFAASEVRLLPIDTEVPPNNQTVYFLLLQAGDQIYGTLRLSFAHPLTPIQTRLINTVVIQAAAALQRIALAESARKSRAFEDADRLKTALLHAVSHDLRTPITIIKTSVSNLLNLYNSLPPDERDDMLHAIESEADQLNKMVGNLLDLSRLQAGALQLDSHLNNLEEVVGDVAARVWQTTKQERIKMTFPDDFPLVSFDYGLILQALTNLVDNALRYEPATSQVEIRGSFTTDEARVAVINHGRNLSPEEREHIMEPFYHGKDGHVGLGLPIAKGVVEAHQGRLWAEDTPGSGATFILALPIIGQPHGESARGG